MADKDKAIFAHIGVPSDKPTEEGEEAEEGEKPASTSGDAKGQTVVAYLQQNKFDELTAGDILED